MNFCLILAADRAIGTKHPAGMVLAEIEKTVKCTACIYTSMTQRRMDVEARNSSSVESLRSDRSLSSFTVPEELFLTTYRLPAD